MNSFRNQYIVIKMEDDYYDLIQKQLEQARAIDRNNKPIEDYQDSKVEGLDHKEGSYDEVNRSSKSRFIDDERLYGLVDGFARFANSKAEWNYDIDFIEPIQDTLYEVGGYYDWHIDESNWYPGKRQSNRIRKISFTILLNDDFEGGEFELFADEKKIIPLKKKDVILFMGDTPHRVRKVTSGVRKSLVGWVQGPAYK
tara:strand:- start:2538 stop:3131 length:594 start_codon:yes stop_codon:yes gene_type:complete